MFSWVKFDQTIKPYTYTYKFSEISYLLINYYKYYTNNNVNSLIFSIPLKSLPPSHHHHHHHTKNNYKTTTILHITSHRHINQFTILTKQKNWSTHSLMLIYYTYMHTFKHNTVEIHKTNKKLTLLLSICRFVNQMNL